MEKIIVTLGKRSYPITIATGLFNNADSFLPLQPGDKAMLITNKTLAQFYADKIKNILTRVGIILDILILPDGEQYKNLTVLDTIFTSLLKNMHNRNTTLIALGGGVIGDITGFAAASYQRGVRFIQVPTTLLAQVDSSIGGKTAINHQFGKNMIGAFWQPSSVLVDLNCLKTLPHREFVSGLAEVIKYGVTLDSVFFCWLEKNIEILLHLDELAITYCIRRCCELKAKIIEVDEYETGLRTLLNLGHTYGHAIEAEVGYGNWLHGEAIAVGMVMAARTAERLGKFKKEETQRIISLLQRAGLPVTRPQEIPVQNYLPYIIRDKKTLSGAIRLVLPVTIGKSKIYDEVSFNIILHAIADCQ